MLLCFSPTFPGTLCIHWSVDLAKNLLSDYTEPQSLLFLSNVPVKAIGLAIAFAVSPALPQRQEHSKSESDRSLPSVAQEKNLNFQWRAQVCVSFLGAVLSCAKSLQS